MAQSNRKLSRRMTAILWFGVVGIVCGILIYLEQIPILYVLATLSLVILLIVVAFSDLESVGREAMEQPSGKPE